MTAGFKHESDYTSTAHRRVKYSLMWDQMQLGVMCLSDIVLYGMVSLFWVYVYNCITLYNCITILWNLRTFSRGWFLLRPCDSRKVPDMSATMQRSFFLCNSNIDTCLQSLHIRVATWLPNAMRPEPLLTLWKLLLRHCPWLITRLFPVNFLRKRLLPRNLLWLHCSQYHSPTHAFQAPMKRATIVARQRNYKKLDMSSSTPTHYGSLPCVQENLSLCPCCVYAYNCI